jgi:excisionase family DNA binding protein
MIKFDFANALLYSRTRNDKEKQESILFVAHNLIGRQSRKGGRHHRFESLICKSEAAECLVAFAFSALNKFKEFKLMLDQTAAKQNYLDIDKAAERLGCAPVTVRRLVASKEIEHLRLGAGVTGGRVYFTQAMLNDFIARRTIRPLAKAA